MEVTQFTYFQQLGGLELDLVPAEITYGLERLAMFLQGKRLGVRARVGAGRDVGRRLPRERAPVVDLQLRGGARRRAHAPLRASTRPSAAHLVERGLPLPAYDQVLKCSHAFNLLDARGAISVTERAAYIGRVRALARRVAQPYVEATRRCRRSCLRSAARSFLPRAVARRRQQLPERWAPTFGGSSALALVGPRRIALVVEDFELDERGEEKRGPAEAVAFDEGKPTKAAEGFARGLGLTVDELELRDGLSGVAVRPPAAGASGCWQIVLGLGVGKTMTSMRLARPTVRFPRPDPLALREARRGDDRVGPEGIPSGERSARASLHGRRDRDRRTPPTTSAALARSAESSPTPTSGAA